MHTIFLFQISLLVILVTLCHGVRINLWIDCMGTSHISFELTKLIPITRLLTSASYMKFHHKVEKTELILHRVVMKFRRKHWRNSHYFMMYSNRQDFYIIKTNIRAKILNIAQICCVYVLFSNSENPPNGNMRIM
jgi:hypothetical protein